MKNRFFVAVFCIMSWSQVCSYALITVSPNEFHVDEMYITSSNNNTQPHWFVKDHTTGKELEVVSGFRCDRHGCVDTIAPKNPNDNTTLIFPIPTSPSLTPLVFEEE